MSTNPNWKFNSDHEILVACVGYNFGARPEEKLDEIRASRGGYGRTVASRLNITKDDVVLDIGSGCGFVGRTIAPLAKKLLCVDLSPDFLQYCKKELAEFGNVECRLINYADYSALSGCGVTKVYSTAVWIHFNYYDFYHNLMSLRDVLSPGGELYFDYADPEGIRDGNGRIFNEHASGYRNNREAIFNLVQYNGVSAVNAVLQSTGFSLKDRWQTGAECFSIRAVKV